MAEADSDEQRCDTSKSLEETDMDERSDGGVEETVNNSSTFDFAEKSWMTDFTLVVEGTKYYVAKNILAFSSPVFRRMFESDFKESTSDELELPGKKADAFKEFLIAIYPNTADVMTKENALKVLPLADEYQVSNLKRRCEEVILGSVDAETPTKELYRLIKEAQLYNLSKLTDVCVHLLSVKPAEEIESANKEIVLPEEPLRAIVQMVLSRVKDLDSSNTQFIEQLEITETLNNYILKALKRSDVPKLREDLAWKGKIWTFTFDIDKMRSVEDNVSMIWNTRMKVEFCTRSWNDGSYDTSEGICANLINGDKHEIECDFEIQYVVVNKMPKEEHISVKRKITFSSNNQSGECKLAKMWAIEDPKKGFVYEGKVQIEANILMSEPRKLESLNM